MDGLQFLQQGDAVTRGVALLLLAMSVASWVVILWKAWLLRRATGDVARSTAAFWQAASVAGLGRRLTLHSSRTIITRITPPKTAPASHGGFDNDTAVISATLERITGMSTLSLPVDDLVGF